MEQVEESVFIRHEPCPSCGSRDNLGRYSDHAFCFGCGHFERENNMDEEVKYASDFADTFAGEYKNLNKRGITADTCRKFDYRVSQHNGKTCQVASFYKDRKVVAQKLRFADKTFKWIGDAKNAELFGQHLWKEQAKIVCVCEGPQDAMSLSQVQGNKWPVVSIKDGAQGAKREIQRALEWLLKYENVVFMFDMDEAGQTAAKACAALLPPGRAKIAELPLKDANDMLVQGRAKELLSAMWEAKVYRPDGIVSGDDLWAQLSKEDVVESVDYPYPGLTEKTRGLRKSELTTITAGSGIGKSALAREIGYHLITNGETVGFIMLEETVKRTALSLMGLHLNKPLHLGIQDTKREELRDAYDFVIGNNKTYFYDSFGSTQIDNLLNRVRFLAQGCECSYIVLDHLSIVVSGLGDGDERLSLIHI